MFAGDADFVMCRALQFPPEHHVLDFRCIQQATAFCFDLRVQKIPSSFPRCRARFFAQSSQVLQGFRADRPFRWLALSGGIG